MRTLLLTFDVEEYPAKELRVPVSEDNAFLQGDMGLSATLDLLERYGVRATFFVTMEFASRMPKNVNRLVGDGHELAMHGLRHGDDYHSIPDETTRMGLTTGRKEMERRFHSAVVGFRGPRMSRPPYHVLQQCGFMYDSSLHPTLVPGRYNNLGSPRGIHRRDGIWVVPVSVVPGVRWPISWSWKMLGRSYLLAASQLTLMKSDYLLVYFHPWEFAPPPAELSGFFRRRMFGGTGHIRALESLLKWSRDMMNGTIVEYLQ